MDFTYNGRQPHMSPHNANNTVQLGGIIYLGSLYLYFQRHFRVNRNVPKFVAFAGVSYFIACDWAKALALPVLQEAALSNNNLEAQHLAKLKALQAK